MLLDTEVAGRAVLGVTVRSVGSVGAVGSARIWAAVVTYAVVDVAVRDVRIVA